jgi:DNA-binding LytR/AlgR family response regulator
MMHGSHNVFNTHTILIMMKATHALHPESPWHKPKEIPIWPELTLQALRTPKQKLAISTTQEVLFIPVDAIHYCQAESNYVRLHYADGKTTLISRTLRAIEQALPSTSFIRVHQSYLVNIREVFAFSRDKLTLENGITIPVSRHRHTIVRETLIRSAFTI